VRSTAWPAPTHADQLHRARRHVRSAVESSASRPHSVPSNIRMCLPRGLPALLGDNEGGGQERASSTKLATEIGSGSQWAGIRRDVVERGFGRSSDCNRRRPAPRRCQKPTITWNDRQRGGARTSAQPMRACPLRRPGRKHHFESRTCLRPRSAATASRQRTLRARTRGGGPSRPCRSEKQRSDGRDVCRRPDLRVPRGSTMATPGRPPRRRRRPGQSR